MTKTCFCKSCQLCEEKPKDCRLLKKVTNVFTFLDYANKTQDEIDNSLKGKI